MTYQTIDTKNDWEYITYHANGERLKFTDGDQVRVRWPNNFESLETIVVGLKTREYLDMGHRYTATSPTYTFDYDVNGINASIDISQVMIHQDDLKYFS